MGFSDSSRTTLSGKPPAAGWEDSGAPQPLGLSGQHGDYWILSEAERSKGFVRPLRSSYRHVGERPTHPLRDLTDDERKRYAADDYAAYEAYPSDPESSLLGRFWTQAQLESGCGSVTAMPLAIAETYARNPSFYGKTYCCRCEKHFPVAEFIWEGTAEVVGS